VFGTPRNLQPHYNVAPTTTPSFRIVSTVTASIASFAINQSAESYPANVAQIGDEHFPGSKSNR
jgi:hypothetical protein